MPLKGEVLEGLTVAGVAPWAKYRLYRLGRMPIYSQTSPSLLCVEGYRTIWIGSQEEYSRLIEKGSKMMLARGHVAVCWCPLCDLSSNNPHPMKSVPHDVTVARDMKG